MTRSPEIIRDEVSERLFQAYSKENAELLERARAIVTPLAPKLADRFYEGLLAVPEARNYIDHHVVSERLHRSMADWIGSLFTPKDELAVLEHMKQQRLVGAVHARINVPMKLVNHGIRILKAEIDELLQASTLSDAERYLELALINDLIDYSAALINESYLEDHVKHEGETGSLRLHLIGASFAIELERLRSSLFDWLRRAITRTYDRFPGGYPALSSVYHSDFGLWVGHKADLLLAEHQAVTEKLKQQVAKMEECIELVNGLKGEENREALSRTIENLNESVSSVAWLLSDLASETYEMDHGRDPLTRLFNRRFLAAVLQNMIRTTRAVSSWFTVLSLDLDKFKAVNDARGHEGGDRLLVAFSEFIATQVRATDFVFRLGGDEFLVVLAGADSSVGVRIAQGILSQLETRRFDLGSGAIEHIGTSIGIAQFDGHPDYLHILKRADEALLQAKKQGGRRYFVLGAAAA